MAYFAIYDRLAADAQLTAELATWGGGPAIFSAPPIPEDADLPAIVIEGPEGDDPADTKTTTGRTQTRAITVYTEATGDIALVERLAGRVVVLFHRFPLGPAGTQPWRTEATGPVVAPTDGTLYGRRVILEMSW